MSFRVAIVGSGATALYSLKHLAKSATPLDITVFSASAEFGAGMPYSAAMSADYMLCNAFSREIPSVAQSLFEWLKQRPGRELNAWELSRHELSPRAFYPRVLIGDYLKDQFQAAVRLAGRNGHSVTLAPETPVGDVRPGRDIRVQIADGRSGEDLCFDSVILAMGHDWPEAPRLGTASLLSPWPFTALTALPPGNIGILGSSLSGIDAATAIAFTHGTFLETDESVSWRPHPGSEALRITMLSKMGVMPEGDFYYTFPYLPLAELSPEAIAAEIAKGGEHLLERAFALMLADLAGADPAYLSGLGPGAETVEGFSKAYFESRRTTGGLAAVKDDFAASRRSLQDSVTIPHRYVLLRAAETFDLVLRALPDDQWQRFRETLLGVFADAFAAVPHLSLARIIALHEAGVLELQATGDDAGFADAAGGGVDVTADGHTTRYDVLVDARGQSYAPADALPFPQLVTALRDGARPVAAPFRLPLADDSRSAPVYCLALPQLLERHPFAQGLADCDRNSRLAVDDVLRIAADARGAEPADPASVRLPVSH